MHYRVDVYQFYFDSRSEIDAERDVCSHRISKKKGKGKCFVLIVRMCFLKGIDDVRYQSIYTYWRPTSARSSFSKIFSLSEMRTRILSAEVWAKRESYQSFIQLPRSSSYSSVKVCSNALNLPIAVTCDIYCVSECRMEDNKSVPALCEDVLFSLMEWEYVFWNKMSWSIQYSTKGQMVQTNMFLACSCLVTKELFVKFCLVPMKRIQMELDSKTMSNDFGLEKFFSFLVRRKYIALRQKELWEGKATLNFYLRLWLWRSSQLQKILMGIPIPGRLEMPLAKFSGRKSIFAIWVRKDLRFN